MMPLAVDETSLDGNVTSAMDLSHKKSIKAFVSIINCWLVLDWHELLLFPFSKDSCFVS